MPEELVAIVSFVIVIITTNIIVAVVVGEHLEAVCITIPHLIRRCCCCCCEPSGAQPFSGCGSTPSCQLVAVVIVVVVLSHRHRNHFQDAVRPQARPHGVAESLQGSVRYPGSLREPADEFESKGLP